MILYEKGDPIRAVEILGPDIRSVHVKDAIGTKVSGTWGDEVPLGQGQANIKLFIKTLQKVGYRGALCIEREVGNQEQRVADLAHGIRYVRVFGGSIEVYPQGSEYLTLGLGGSF